VNPLESFVEEIRSTAGVWTVYAARFTPREPAKATSVEFEPRKTRPKPIPWPTLMRLCRTSDRWSFRWVAAHRRGKPRFVDAPGWRVLVWCYVIVDDAEPDMLPFNLGVQIFSTRRATQAGPVPTRIRRSLLRKLEPLGFHEMRITPPQPFFMVEKDVATRALAKRERSRLDQAVFGDSQVPRVPRRQRSKRR
jgi:hypothetical protein